MGAGRFQKRSAPNSPGGPLKAYWGHSVFLSRPVTAKHANKKESVPRKIPRNTRKPRKPVWSASPCLYPSRCSRFKKFKGSVRCNFHREMRESHEQKRECLRKLLIHSQKDLPKGICPKSRATGVFSLSPILPPVVAQNLRKFVLVCFSMFASFALFAVHVFHLECSLSF